MQAKWKRMTTVALTGALVASQALMASAAGGRIDADMSTKTPVLRVVVPTKMAVAVNEFEMGDTGSQVTSEAFTMKNVSEIPVNVEVTSTATLGTGVTLVSTKAAAQEATDNAMWLAAVAAVADNSGTLEYLKEGTDKTVAALAGTESNATAFATENSASTAVQDFYLAAATAAQYKAIIGTDAEDIGEGADFYKLTVVTMADQNAVNTALKTQDLYTVTTAPVSGTGQNVNKLGKGTTDATFGSLTYYTMAPAPETYATVKADNSGIYLYIDSATTAAGDAAAFRYAGALSSAKSGWSTTDLSAIEIAYDITGVTASSYDDIKDDLVYGYKGVAGSKISITATGLMTVEGLSGETYQSGTVTLNGTDYAIDATSGRWTETTAPAKFQFSTTWANNIKGKTVTVKIVLKDGTEITETVDVPEN